MKAVLLFSVLAFASSNVMAGEKKKDSIKNLKKDSSYVGKLRASLQGNNVHIRY